MNCSFNIVEILLLNISMSYARRWLLIRIACNCSVDQRHSTSWACQICMERLFWMVVLVLLEDQDLLLDQIMMMIWNIWGNTNKIIEPFEEKSISFDLIVRYGWTWFSTSIQFKIIKFVDLTSIEHQQQQNSPNVFWKKSFEWHHKSLSIIKSNKYQKYLDSKTSIRTTSMSLFKSSSSNDDPPVTSQKQNILV